MYYIETTNIENGTMTTDRSERVSFMAAHQCYWKKVELLTFKENDNDKVKSSVDVKMDMYSHSGHDNSKKLEVLATLIVERENIKTRCSLIWANGRCE